MARMKFMNTEIDNLTMQETLQAIDQLIRENKSAYKKIQYPQMLLALVIGCVASVWVKMLGWNSFFVLLLSAILFFGSYGLVLLIAHEPLVLEIVTQVIDKAKKVCNK